LRNIIFKHEISLLFIWTDLKQKKNTE